MEDDVPDNAPPNAQLLIDWGEDNAENVGVSSVEEQGLFEVNVTFADASLMVAGTLGQEGAPGLWETASLIRSNEIETNTAIQFPQQMNAPLIVHDEEEDRLTVRTVDAELTLHPNPAGAGEDGEDDEQ